MPELHLIRIYELDTNGSANDTSDDTIEKKSKLSAKFWNELQYKRQQCKRNY